MGLLDRFRPDPDEADDNAGMELASSLSDTPEVEPHGASGRGHTEGFLDLEELNRALQHPHGHRIYDQMYRTDADVRQVVSLSCNPIMSGTWGVSPYGGENATPEDTAIAEFVHAALFEYMSPNLLGHLQVALPILVRSGFAAFEVPWMAVEYKGEMKLVPRSLQVRLPRTIQQFEQNKWGDLTRVKQFLPVPNSALTATEGQSRSMHGEEGEGGFVWINASEMVYYRVGAEGDNWEGVSMLRPAYKHWLMKDKIERIDAVAQEREALGVPICYPPTGATPGQLDDMEAVLKNMRANEQAFIIAPGPKAGAGAPDGVGWLIDILGYDRTGSGRDPQPSLAYHTNKIAAAFISEFMRLGHGTSGARATAQVQADPFLMSIEALTHIVEDVLNDQLVRPLVNYNYPNIENPPRLQMSLVDSTSLTQLADYVLKLSQIGALLPDQELEDFLRARADLPPANPISVKKRKTDDDQIRRDIVTGGGGGDAYGANAPVGKHGHHDTAQKDQKTTGLDDDTEGTVTLAWSEEFDRSYRRNPRDYEMAVDLDALEDEMDSAPETMDLNVRPHVMDLARGGSGKGLEDVIHSTLLSHYRSGGEHVQRELGLPDDDHKSLDKGAADRGENALRQRANLAGASIRHAVDAGRQHADLTHGTDNPAHTQAAGEKAGAAAARKAGRVHGVAALLHGRHDVALDASDFIIGARYTAILDRNTCGPCREADDGEVRELDDPVRVDRRPPNRHCDSTNGIENQCRCFEVYEPIPPAGTTSLSAGDAIPGVPDFIAREARKLIDTRGMDPSRAIRAAVARARVWASGGGKVPPAARDAARAAVEAFDSQ